MTAAPQARQVSINPSTACPKLSQAFQMLRSSPMRINCDLKQPGLEEAVLALAASQGVAGQLLFSIPPCPYPGGTPARGGGALPAGPGPSPDGGCWGVNGFLQAMLWPPLVRIMTELFTEEVGGPPVPH